MHQVVRALHRTAHAHVGDIAQRVLVALRDDTVVFNVELLLCARMVLAVDNKISSLEGLCESVFSVLRLSRIHHVSLKAICSTACVAALPHHASRIVVLDGCFRFFNGEHAGKFVVLDVDRTHRGQ